MFDSQALHPTTSEELDSVGPLQQRIDMEDEQNDLCEQCGRHFDRPGFYQNCEHKHPRPSKAQRLVEEIETTLTQRKDLYKIYYCDEDVQREIRDELEDIVRDFAGRSWR